MRYRVTLARTATKLLDVIVDASSEEDACEQALREAGNYDFSGCSDGDPEYDVHWVLEEPEQETTCNSEETDISFDAEAAQEEEPSLLDACKQAEYWLTIEEETGAGVRPTEILKVLRGAIARERGP
jgi:hypothetical protein